MPCAAMKYPSGNASTSTRFSACTKLGTRNASAAHIHSANSGRRAARTEFSVGFDCPCTLSSAPTMRGASLSEIGLSCTTIPRTARGARTASGNFNTVCDSVVARGYRSGQKPVICGFPRLALAPQSMAANTQKAGRYVPASPRLSG